MHFNIEHWQAWAPGIQSPDDWARWSAAPGIPPVSTVQPALAFLPALQRRRLSRLARMTFAVAWPLAEGQSGLPLVFVSRHGDTQRTFALLGDLAQQEPLSPTQFSLSVHNASIGLWSILRGDTSEMTAVAGEGDGLEHGLLEAGLLLQGGAPAVLLVIAEDTPPSAYAPWIHDVPFPYALGLLLTPGHDWQLSLSPCAADPSLHSEWPHALNLLRALSGQPAQRQQVQQQWKTRRWSWQCNR